MLKNKNAVVALSLLLVCVVAGIFFFSQKENPRKNELLVAYLDVGQGDSIFLQAPDGKQVLIDGGRDKKALGELSRLMPKNDKTIDIMIATHADSDHIGGLPFILDKYEIENIFLDGVAGDSEEYFIFDSKTKIETKNIFTINAPRRIVLDAERSIFLDIFFPDRDTTGWETNTASIVCKLTYNQNTFLFTGDSPKEIEDYLVAKYKNTDFLDIDVLKLGHHGSKTSTDDYYLDATTPKLAIISAGKDNRYGHPSPEILARLVEHSIPYLSTIDFGTIRLYSDGQTINYDE